MLISNQRFSTIQQHDVDAEGVENVEDGYNSDLSLDFHQ